MKCAVHPDVDATGYCRHCGKPLCAQCTRDVRGALYCEDCLSTIVFGDPNAKATAKPVNSSPGAALVLGFIPGLGAVYNAEYVKALIHVCIFGGIIAGLNSDIPGGWDALLGIALACFYFYMPIDAYRVAKARELGQPVPEPFPLVGTNGNAPVGPIILIGLGVLLLFANFGLFRWYLFGRFWPVILIAIGAWILFGRAKQVS
ncbi:MAG TPA: B-box zinc finger protein [Candidatus Acidoferrales bacterium]|nr:B-box zinc finger protein [Candidatus Acidoferrales bacterium]